MYAALTRIGVNPIVASVLCYGQRFVLYPAGFPAFPDMGIAIPELWGLPGTDLALRTPDGVTLQSVRLDQRCDIFDLTLEPSARDAEYAATRPTVLMFHGNAMDHGGQLPVAQRFYRELRCNVVMATYRGYGQSDGVPSEKGLRIDAQTTLDYILRDPLLSRTPLIIYGQSLGGAVAIDVASRNPDKLAALIVENTFPSIRAVLALGPPLLRALIPFVHQRWESARKARRLAPHTPVLVLSGARDEVVPPPAVRALHAALAARGPATFVELPRGGHNDTFVQAGYWLAVRKVVEGVITADTAAVEGVVEGGVEGVVEGGVEGGVESVTTAETATVAVAADTAADTTATAEVKPSP